MKVPRAGVYIRKVDLTSMVSYNVNSLDHQHNLATIGLIVIFTRAIKQVKDIVLLQRYEEQYFCTIERYLVDPPFREELNWQIIIQYKTVALRSNRKLERLSVNKNFVKVRQVFIWEKA